jgi:16S rRNA (uracil1498-N3)-methyltransferase
MSARIFVAANALSMSATAEFALDTEATRHTQVLRLQPGDALTLFDGTGGQWRAQVRQMQRSRTTVQLLAHEPIEREARCAVHLLVAPPANDRMDLLVEKATELGAQRITPVLTQRAVLRLTPERAEKKRAHWQAVAVAASEQCGRNRVPRIDEWQPLAQALCALGQTAGARWLLQPDAATPLAAQGQPAPTHATLLSGPEGGLTDDEAQAAIAAAFTPVSLGPRILRADTAPLAALAWLTLRGGA